MSIRGFNIDYLCLVVCLLINVGLFVFFLVNWVSKIFNFLFFYIEILFVEIKYKGFMLRILKVLMIFLEFCGNLVFRLFGIVFKKLCVIVWKFFFGVRLFFVINLWFLKCNFFDGFDCLVFFCDLVFLINFWRKVFFLGFNLLFLYLVSLVM